MYKIIYLPINIKRFAAITIPMWGNGLIFIERGHKDDKPLLEHEKVHLKHKALKYLLNKDYRFRCEIEAYAVQLHHMVLLGNDYQKYFDMYVGYIMDNYRLNVGRTGTEKLLKMKYDKLVNLNTVKTCNLNMV